jgi:GNAT superfamily N-acetyltransferase
MNDSPILRPFAPQDHEPLTHLLRTLWGDDPTANAYYRFGPASSPGAAFLHTIVAEHDGHIAGFGSLWTNRMHPYSLYIGVNVHPDHQARGIGAAIYARLLRARGGYASLPLQTATWSDCVPVLRFLARHGFREDKRTYLPRIQLSGVRISGYRTVEEQCAVAGYRVASLAELAPTLERNRRVAALAADLYRATHPSNPPAPLTPAEWEEIVFDDIVEAGCFVALKGDEYGGISFLHPHEQPDTLWFGWRGVASPYRHDEDLILRMLVYHELRYAQRHGYARLQAEIDTTDPWAMRLLNLLPFSSERAWVTLRSE